MSKPPLSGDPEFLVSQYLKVVSRRGVDAFIWRALSLPSTEPMALSRTRVTGFQVSSIPEGVSDGEGFCVKALPEDGGRNIGPLSFGYGVSEGGYKVVRVEITTMSE